LSNFEIYFPLAIQIFIAVVIGLAMFFVSSLFGKKTYSRVKEQAYECGIEAESDSRQRFPIKFYLVAILFIIFDLETVFLFPWAVNYKSLGLFGFVEMGVFILILLVGYVYIVKKGALKWD
jgi:NADH-quinone oxidoreductase subunit A